MWNTSLSAEQEEALKTEFPQLVFDFGFRDDKEEMLRLSSPILKNDKQVIASGEKIVLEHKMKGVSVRYTMDDTEPDSINSPIYTEPLILTESATLKAKAYKHGWMSSGAATFKFYIRGIEPTNVELLSHPDPMYPGAGVRSLTDGIIGNPNLHDYPVWLGYIEPAEFLVDLGSSPQSVREIKVNYLVNLDNRAFPPSSAEIWGGNDPNQMNKLSKKTSTRPTEYVDTQVEMLDFDLENASYRYYKIVLNSFGPLPKWMKREGDSFVFVGEIFLY